MVKREKVVVIGLPVVFFLVGVVFGYSLGDVHDSELVDRQRIIHDRFTLIMPFDVEQSRHVFHEHRNGGMIQVYTNSTSTEEIARIQNYLKVEYDRYRTGNFTNEIKLHGQHMPGIRELSENFSQITFVYSNMQNGAQIQLITNNPKLLDAIHIWFRAQLLDHGTHALSIMEGAGEM